MEDTEALGTLDFWDGTPIAKMPAEDALRLLEYIGSKNDVWWPPAKSYVPIDRMNPDHVRLLCSTLPCIGYEVREDETGAGSAESPLGKDADFEVKHDNGI